MTETKVNKIITKSCNSDFQLLNVMQIYNVKYIRYLVAIVFKMFLTYKLGRLSTLKGALLAVGSALRKVEMGRMNMVFVWQTTVHRLT